MANYSNRAICLYDINQDSVIKFDSLLGYPQYSKVKFFDNDTKIAVAYSSGINIYDVKTWKIIKQIGISNGHTKFIREFDISDDESRIVTCANDFKIIIWDLKTGEKIEEIGKNMSTPRVKYFDRNILLPSPGGFDGFEIYDLNLKKTIKNINNMNSFNGLLVSNKKNYILFIESMIYILIDFILASVTEGKGNYSQILFPNPASDFIEISYSPSREGVGGVSFEIYNVFGLKVLSTPAYPTPALPEGEGVRVDVTGLAAGVYFVRSGNKTQRFVIIR